MKNNNISFEKNIADSSMNACISQTLFAIDDETLSDEDSDYKPLYYFLFNGITDILELNKKYVCSTNNLIHSETIDALKKLQREAEKLFLNQN